MRGSAATGAYSTMVTQQGQGFRMEPIMQIKRMFNYACETGKYQIATLSQGLKIASKQDIISLELRMLREHHDSKGNTSWVCVACKKIVSFSKPQFTNCGYLDTPHSKSDRHLKQIELLYRLDAFVGVPSVMKSDPSRNSIRNQDRVIEKNAKDGYFGEVTKHHIRMWWGECVDRLPDVLKLIHLILIRSSRYTFSPKTQAGKKSFSCNHPTSNHIHLH